jgi:hypothetical protein
MVYVYTDAQAIEFGLLLLLDWREARGQALAAKTAVAWSVANRVKKVAQTPGFWGWQAGWLGVIGTKDAYSSLTATGNPDLTEYPSQDDPALPDCIQACQAPYWGIGTDPTDGAVMYYDSSIPPPAWASSPLLAHCLDVGAFHFFRLAS